MHQVGLGTDLTVAAKGRRRHAHQPALFEIPLHLPERQPAPTETGADHRMFRILAADATGLRREHAEIPPHCPLRRIGLHDLKVVGKRGVFECAIGGTQPQGMMRGNDCNDLNRRKRLAGDGRIAEILSDHDAEGEAAFDEAIQRSAQR
ncbi:hypothetical protein D9M72_477440 [compost metagenome]